MLKARPYPDTKIGDNPAMESKTNIEETTVKAEEWVAEEMTPDDMTHIWNVLRNMEIKSENIFTCTAPISNIDVIDVKPEPQLQSGMKFKSHAEDGYFKPPPRISRR